MKDINGIEIVKEKSGSYRIKGGKNLYYLRDGVRKPFLIGWDELNKKNMNIKSKKEFVSTVISIILVTIFAIYPLYFIPVMKIPIQK